MREITIDCYEITEPDGGGVRDVHLMYVGDVCTAKHICDTLKAQTNWGKNYKPFKKTFRIFDSFEDYEQNNVSEAKKRALSKLTAAEKAALGF